MGMMLVVAGGLGCLPWARRLRWWYISTLGLRGASKSKAASVGGLFVFILLVG